MLIELFSFCVRLWLSRYERKDIENWRFRSSVVCLIPNYRYKESPPPIIFARIVRPMNALQRNFVADFLQAKCDFRRKSAVLHFWALFGGLGATDDDHLRLIRKRVVDFLLVLIELFSLGVTAEALQANIGWKSAISLQRGPVDPKFQVKGVAPTNLSSSQKTTLNYLSYGIKIWTDLSSVLSVVTVHAFERQTDGRTDARILIARPRLHCMQRGKNNCRFSDCRFVLRMCLAYVIK